jgi:hypothetical protein
MKAYGQSKLACLMFALEITNDFATVRDVAIFDYPGVGLSSGVTPSTVARTRKLGPVAGGSIRLARRADAATARHSDFDRLSF